MPRFLEIDYFKCKSTPISDTLSRIPSPRLDLNDVSFLSDTFENENYLKPWTKVHPDWSFMDSKKNTRLLESFSQNHNQFELLQRFLPPSQFKEHFNWPDNHAFDSLQLLTCKRPLALNTECYIEEEPSTDELGGWMDDYCNEANTFINSNHFYKVPVSEDEINIHYSENETSVFELLNEKVLSDGPLKTNNQLDDNILCQITELDLSEAKDCLTDEERKIFDQLDENPMHDDDECLQPNQAKELPQFLPEEQRVEVEKQNSDKLDSCNNASGELRNSTNDSRHEMKITELANMNRVEPLSLFMAFRNDKDCCDKFLTKRKDESPRNDPNSPSKRPKLIEKNTVKLLLTGSQKMAMLQVLSKAKPLLRELQELNIFGSRDNCVNISPDVVLLKLSGNPASTSTTSSMMKSLYCYLLAMELIKENHIGSAVSFLKCWQMKFEGKAKYELQSLDDDLTQIDEEEPFSSCKIKWICDHITSHTMQNRNGKILVVLSQHFDVISHSLKAALTKCPSIRCGLIKATNCQQENEEENLVYIASKLALNSISIEWRSKFTCLIEYSGTDLDILSWRHLMHWMCLSVVSIEDLLNEDVENSRNETVTMIVSSKIAYEHQLLRHAEKKHGIQFVVRDYGCSKSHHADIIIDEKNCVLLLNLSSFENLSVNQMVGTLLNQVIALSLQTSICWLVIVVDTRNMAKFSAYLSCLFQMTSQFNSDDFCVKVIYAQDNAHVAKILKKITASSTSSPASDGMNFEMTKHESWLINFPSLNSFTAQMMLAAASLAELLKMSKLQLQLTFPTFPRKIINLFCDVIHQTSVIHQHLISENKNPNHRVAHAQSHLEATGPVSSSVNAMHRQYLQALPNSQDHHALTDSPPMDLDTSFGSQSFEDSPPLDLQDGSIDAFYADCDDLHGTYFKCYACHSELRKSDFESCGPCYLPQIADARVNDPSRTPSKLTYVRSSSSRQTTLAFMPAT